MLALGVPCITLGTLAIEIQKFNRGHGHFVTWHGVAIFFRVSRSHSLTILSDFRTRFNRMARGTGDAWRRKCVVWGCRVWGRDESQDDLEIPQVSSVGCLILKAANDSHHVSQAVRLCLTSSSPDHRSSWRCMVYLGDVP
jgi:hypothetical protein